MPNDRRRILELALESLELKKKEIEEEIAEINRELRGRTTIRKSAPKARKQAAAKKVTRKPAAARKVARKSAAAQKAARKPASPPKAAKKRTRFTKEERLRRSQRMKEYWDNWRKNKANAK